MDLFTPPPSSKSSKNFVAGLDLEKLKLSDTGDVNEQLTPPATPLNDVHPRGSETESIDSELEPTTARRNAELFTFDGTLELAGEIGRGAWSTVVAAHDKPARATISQQPLTPPASPAYSLKTKNCYAVKLPSHNLALPIIRNEALILSHLTKYPQSASHIVRFHGLDPATSSIVLSRCPETLSTIASAALRAERSSARRSSFDPIIGLKYWLDIALQLVRGLSWMHQTGVIHGDIKTSNILLAPSTVDSSFISEGSSVNVLYCDFSSARLLSTSAESASSGLPTDAITTSYASPELLKAYSRSYSLSPGSSDLAVATEASDIWALAVTLVVAAVGEDPYAQTGHEMRKLAMAKEGLVLDGVRMGGFISGMRVKKGGAVERAVKGALAKRVEARIGAETWIELLEGIKSEEESTPDAVKI